MMTTDDINICRLGLMLVKGGTKISKALFGKCVKDLTPENHIPYPWTLYHFLNANKTKILGTQTGKAKKNILFPTGGANTQVQQWDLYMYCFFLIEICGVKPDVRMDIEQLRKMRNKICHQSEPTMGIIQYNRKVEKLEVIYERLLKIIGDDDLTNEINRILKESKEDPLSAKEILVVMHNLNKRDIEIQEILTQQSEDIKTLIEKVEEIGQLCRGLTGFNLENCTETCVELRVKNCAWHTEKNISNILVDMYRRETGQSSSEQSEQLSDQERAELMAAVKDTIATFVSKKRAIFDAEEQCVVLLIKCSTFNSLLSLYYDCINGDLNKEFRQLELAVRHINGLEEVSLEVVIYEDEFYKTMKRTGRSQRRLSPENMGAGKEFQSRSQLQQPSQLGMCVLAHCMHNILV